MGSRDMWMVRADVGGRLYDDFESLGIVAIGWRDLGDMSALKSLDDFRRAVASAYPDHKRQQQIVSAGQAHKFVRQLAIGDRVLTYDPSERKYLVGTIAGDYEYDNSRPDFKNVRRVTWEGSVARDSLTVGTRNSLGAISTLFQVPDEAVRDIERRLKNDTTPAAVIGKEEEETQVDEILQDIQNRAFEFIKDKISRLTWDDMQKLVAGLLRAMGYKTRVSPAGPDQGKDIVASPDGFGFESPRIVVEVKHRTGTAMGSQEVRSFLGGRHKDDKGLYVSTGGFSKDARYEAERASIPLALMDLDALVAAVLDHYERMDSDSQRLIPLRKVYWPS